MNYSEPVSDNIHQVISVDIAVAGGWADVGDHSLVRARPATIDAARDRMRNMLDVNVERMKTEAADLPLLVVGGGAILVDWPVRSVSEVLRPEFSSVANAVGAAIAQVGGEVERMFSLDAISRDEALDQAKQEAVTKTIDAGAREESVSGIPPRM